MGDFNGDASLVTAESIALSMVRCAERRRLHSFPVIQPAAVRGNSASSRPNKNYIIFPFNTLQQDCNRNKRITQRPARVARIVNNAFREFPMPLCGNAFLRDAFCLLPYVSLARLLFVVTFTLFNC